MKQHLNTLFVTTEGAWLSHKGEAVTVKLDQKIRLRVPLHNLDGIVCLGWDINASTSLLAKTAQAGVTLSFLSPHGKFQVAVRGFTPGNVLLRRQQYRVADDYEASTVIAREMIAAKITNCRAVFHRCIRDHPHTSTTLQPVVDRMKRHALRARQANNLDSLRGIEGESAAEYFAALPACILIDEPQLKPTGRTRRPPLDPFNALISFLYAILAHDCRSAAEACGLDSAVGLLHRDRPGRPGLALDLMEEFRPILADRLALSLINRKQLSLGDFKQEDAGVWQLTDDARKTLLTAYQARKQEELRHPFLDEKVSLGLVPHLQARLLARHLRGDLDAYPPFLWP